MRGEATLLNTLSADSNSSARGPRRGLIALVIVGSAFILVGAVSPWSLRVVLRDSILPIFVLLAARGLGGMIASLLNMEQLDRAWRTILSTALGLGALSLAVLTLGCAGLMSHAMWVAIIAILVIVGLIQIASDMLPRPRLDVDLSPWRWCVLIPFAALAMLAASLPPGILWPVEANGYDVLEYHLACPREYFEAGRIEFLPHNIYSNFPFNMEMLYLLLMILRGDVLQAAISAQILHVAVAALAVAAIWLAGGSISNRAGFIAAILAASCPVLVSLSSMAYVESALVLFSAMALVTMLKSREGESRNALKWIFLSGAFTGLACGCKYIAVPCLLLPLAIVPLVARPLRARAVLPFLFGAAVTFSPWLIKNAVMTGNPVFPLARDVFEEKPGVWTEDGASRWHEGHLPGMDDRSIGRRCYLLAKQLFTGSDYGVVPALAVVSIIILARRRGAKASISILAFAAVIITWTFFTHLVPRFAILLIPPACILVAEVCDRYFTRPGLTIIIPASGVLLNLGLLANLFTQSHVLEIARERRSDSLEWFTQGQWPSHEHLLILNRVLDEKHKVLMVADARRFYLHAGVDYCVVFNPNPFADAAERYSPEDLLDWLREQGCAFIHVDWGEMRRLRRTRYGFWKAIDERLFEELVEKGMKPLKHFTIEGRSAPYATLFAIPPATSPEAQIPVQSPPTSARS
jgi:hypothetical protein